MSAGTELDPTEGTIHESIGETDGEWRYSNEFLSAYGPDRSFTRSLANRGKKVAIAKWPRNGKTIARWNDHNTNFYSIWTMWYN